MTIPWTCTVWHGGLLVVILVLFGGSTATLLGNGHELLKIFRTYIQIHVRKKAHFVGTLGFHRLTQTIRCELNPMNVQPNKNVPRINIDQILVHYVPAIGLFYWKPRRGMLD